MKTYFQPILFGELISDTGKVQTVVSKSIFNTYAEAEMYVPTFIMAMEDQGIVFLKESLSTRISELEVVAIFPETGIEDKLN
jgi:hypothetical protein